MRKSKLLNISLKSDLSQNDQNILVHHIHDVIENAENIVNNIKLNKVLNKPVENHEVVPSTSSASNPKNMSNIFGEFLVF